MRRSIKIILGIADLFLLFICMLLAFYSITLPDSYYTHKGSELSLSCYFKVTPEKSDATMQSLKSESEKLSEKTTLKLFGIIPIKEVYIEEVDTPLLVPCGEPFGIKLLSEGVMIVGISEVKTNNGTFSPARYSGLTEGDIIISIDGKKVSSNADVSKIITESSGRTLEVIAKREVTKHFKECKVTCCLTYIVDITCTYTFLTCCYSFSWWCFCTCKPFFHRSHTWIYNQ